MPVFSKHFTVEEAIAELDTVRAAVEKMEDIKSSLGIAASELEPLLKNSGGNGGGKKSAHYLDSILELNNLVNSLMDKGIIVKDVNIGLVDFPHMRDGKEVFLCFKMGEDTIRYWHDLHSGYAGRKPL